MEIPVRLLSAGDEAVLEHVAPEVFDEAVRPALSAAFLHDPRHHLAVALDHGLVVGFASAVHYVHPDKPAELWINEIGVAPAYQRRGLGRRLMQALFVEGRCLGCEAAWVLAEGDDEPAQAFYHALGGAPAPAVMFTFDLSDGA